jgi:hypothetical protein
MRRLTKVEVGLAVILLAEASYLGVAKWRQPRLRYLSDYAQKYDPTHRQQAGFIQINGVCNKATLTQDGIRNVAYVSILMDVDTKTGRFYVTKVDSAPDSFRCPQ